MRVRTHNADWLDQASDAIDLRKKLSERRVDTIRERADWLEPDERSLVLAVYRDGRTATEIARLQSSEPRTVRRRLKRAVLRLHDPRFLYVIRHNSKWSPTRRRVALALFRSGLSIREASKSLGISVHHVRRHRERVLALMDGRGPDRSWR